MRESLALAPVPASVPVARRAARYFARLALPDRAREIEMIVSEVFTNVVRHAIVRPGEAVTLTFEQQGDRIRVGVKDQGLGFQVPVAAPSRYGGAGWGLFIVEQLADAWGTARDGRGFEVWAEVGLGAEGTIDPKR